MGVVTTAGFMADRIAVTNNGGGGWPAIYGGIGAC